VSAAPPIALVQGERERRRQEQAEHDRDLETVRARTRYLLFGPRRSGVVRRHVGAMKHPHDDGEQEAGSPEHADERLAPRLAGDVELGTNRHPNGGHSGLK